MSNLVLDDPDDQVAFQLATHQAVVNMKLEFEFHGRLVLTAAALDAVNDIVAGRTYH